MRRSWGHPDTPHHHHPPSHSLPHQQAQSHPWALALPFHLSRLTSIQPAVLRNHLFVGRVSARLLKKTWRAWEEQVKSKAEWERGQKYFAALFLSTGSNNSVLNMLISFVAQAFALSLSHGQLGPSLTVTAPLALLTRPCLSVPLSY